MEDRTVYIIATTTHFVNDETHIEFSISQEAYSTLERAQRFCDRRINNSKIDDYHYVSDVIDNVWYEYYIFPVYVI